MILVRDAAILVGAEEILVGAEAILLMRHDLPPSDSARP